MLRLRAGELVRLYPMTDLASIYIPAHILMLAGTVEVVADRVMRLLTAIMPTCWRIVTFKYDEIAHIYMIWNDETKRVFYTCRLLQQSVEIRKSIQIGTA